jgi:hypothetical protein
MKKLSMLFIVFLGAIGIAHADGVEFAPFYGYRFGGTLVNPQTGNSLQVEPSASVGGTISIPLRSDREHLEFLYSDQNSELSGTILSRTIDMRIEEWQLGINREFPSDYDQMKPFLVGTLGVVNMDFSNNLGAETLFSFGLGGGMKYFFTEHIAFRLDVRAFVSIVEGGGGIACSNGACLASFSGSGFFQGEISPSVVVKF